METKKLTCCDLMIGDYVYSTFSGNPCKVQAIELSEHEYCSVRVSGVEGVKDIVSLSPIRLTAEILEKNGFKNIDTGLDCDGSNIYWKSNNGYSINTQDINLNFVHELQHALRLCGINDKEIVL